MLVVRLRSAVNVLQNHAQQLIGGESKNAEHQVRHDLQGSPDPDHTSSELVFEPGIHPFHGGPYTEPGLMGGFQFSCFTAAGIGINDRDMSQTPAVGGNMLTI